MNRILMFLLVAFSCLSLAQPLVASAHEVYVLTPQEISQAISMPSPNPFTVIPSQELLFLGWGALVAVLVLVTVSASVSKLLERVLDPLLLPLKKLAPLAGRLTLGVSLFASGYYHAFFGPELPFSAVFSSGMIPIICWVFMILGLLIILGFMTRIMAAIALCFFVATVAVYHTYMLTYVNYLGEMILSLILGGGLLSLDRGIPALRKMEKHFRGIKEVFEKYSFLILRVLYGIAVFFASFYAKFLHSNLALDTVRDYHLTNYFHFTPLFLVLGAFIIEALLGICFATGFEVRLAALVFTFFLTISIMFFGEVVWPHVVLFGVNLTLFLHGYDKYTLEELIFQRKRKGEPIL